MEARKLGLLRSKSSKAERERMEPLERNERVCGESPMPMLILMEDPGSIRLCCSNMKSLPDRLDKIRQVER
jgi:hypothetical protein